MAVSVHITSPLDGALRDWDCSSRYERPVPIFENNINWRELLPTNGATTPAGEVVLFTGIQETVAELPMDKQPTWNVVPGALSW